MLKKLRIQNAFVHKDLTIEFQEGNTAIVGKNGRGKSLIPEMVQFAFWGSAALRGVADDYKKLVVELWFHLKGKDYYVIRSANKVILAEDVEGKQLALATGTKPVNAAIIRLFGYGMDVFQVANAANQGAVSALSQMKPTERKNMVDKTVGLNVIDALEKFIAESLKSVSDILNTKREGHFAPTQPESFPEYEPIGPLDERLTKLRKDLQVVEILRAQAEVQIVEPAKPELQKVPLDLFAMRELQEAYVADEAERGAAEKALKGLPAPQEEVVLAFTDIDYDTMAQETAKAREVEQERSTLTRMIGNAPRTCSHTQEELDEEEARYSMLHRWKAREEIRRTLHLNHCPNCNHEWHTPDPRLADYADVPEEQPVITINYADLKIKKHELRKCIEAQPHYEKLDALPTDLQDHTKVLNVMLQRRREYDLYKASLGYEDIRKTLTERLAQPRLTSYTSDIQKAEANDRAMAAYQQAVTAMNEAIGKRDVAKKALETLPADLPVQVAQLDALVRKVLVHDQQVASYNVAKAAFDAKEAEIDALEKDAEAWRLSRAAMADVRAEVKGYLLPSLNRVASHLLAQMTGGELSGLEVNEDFDIKANGQRIETLSGAGKDVSNLALRLGLGTVLTNQTFSVLMLDEIDAGYDEERAAYTSQCLNNLKKTFKQVIVISHKQSITSDHKIEL